VREWCEEGKKITQRRKDAKPQGGVPRRGRIPVRTEAWKSDFILQDICHVTEDCSCSRKFSPRDHELSVCGIFGMSVPVPAARKAVPAAKSEETFVSKSSSWRGRPREVVRAARNPGERRTDAEIKLEPSGTLDQNRRAGNRSSARAADGTEFLESVFCPSPDCGERRLPVPWVALFACRAARRAKPTMASCPT
jgi:hypothetical protein